MLTKGVHRKICKSFAVPIISGVNMICASIAFVVYAIIKIGCKFEKYAHTKKKMPAIAGGWNEAEVRRTCTREMHCSPIWLSFLFAAHATSLHEPTNYYRIVCINYHLSTGPKIEYSKYKLQHIFSPFLPSNVHSFGVCREHTPPKYIPACFLIALAFVLASCVQSATLRE